MSRIRRLSYAISDKGRRATPTQQAARMRDSVLALLEQVNQNAQASRRITKKSAFTVVLRSLQSTRNLPFSLREHMALKELSQYINLAQSNKVNSLTLSHTDLLPVSHPRSTRDHSLTASALREARNRWIADDSRITDDKARTILASALNAEVDSAEHTYFLAMLSALPQGTIPGEVLIAAVGDGNSPLARSLRAQLQRRDRRGRFAYQGGGIRALVRRGSKVFSLVGRTLMDAPDGKVLMELPDGRIAKITPEKGEYVKAILNPTADGFSEKPVKTSVTDDVIDEADLEFVDAPIGWKKVGENSWVSEEDENWAVLKIKDENGKDFFIPQKKISSEGHVLVPRGPKKGEPIRNWAEVLDAIDEVENKKSSEIKPTPQEELDKLKEIGDKNIEELLKQPQVPFDDNIVARFPETKKERKGFEFNYPDGAFKLKVGQPYEPQGAGEDEDVPRDFTDDPVELAQNFDARDLRQALEEAIVPQGENENAFGVGSLEFNDGTGLVEADALYNALKEAGEDADLEVARIYDKANGNDNNEKALLDSRKGEEQVGQSTPDIAEAFERVTEEGTPDVAPAAETPEFVEEKRDETPLPALLKGLTENELARFMESKDHTPHLPKNKDLNVPEGYNKLDPSPFNNWREVTPDNPDPVLPEGFSDNPVFLAQNVSEDELKKELRRAVEPGNEAPGYGAIKLETEDGEEFVANVPGEAIRDALQLQGVDTDEELNKIYTEGRPAQKQGMDDSEAGRIIAEIEKEDGPDAFEQIAGQPFIPKGIVQPLPEFKRDPEEPVDMGGLGIKVGDRVLHRGKYKTVKEVRGEGLDRTVYFEEEYPGENNWLTVGIKQQSVKRLPENAAPETVDVLGEKVIKDPIGLGDWNLDNFVLRKVFGKWTVRDKNGREKFGKYDTMEDAVAAIQERQGKKPTPTPAQPQAAERKPGTATEGEANLDVKAMLDEEEKLADKYQDEEDMTRGDAQAVAEAEMKRKYGKTAIEALNELSREEALRILDEREKDIRGEGLVSVPENKNIRPAAPEDFEVDGLQEIPDGLAEYPAAANVAPAPAAAGGGSGPTPPGGGPKRPPFRITVKVKDLLPGDITVGDHFVITEIGEKVPNTDRIKIKGYYPGHVEQDTKQWNEWREIEVIRGAEAPEKGDLPVLSKPKEKEFGRRKKNADGTWGFANADDQARFDAAMAEYNVQLDAAKKRWTDPTEPANQPHRAIVRAADVKAGDVTTDPKKGHFVIERTFVDENTKPGFVSVEGYYPGHVTQRKEWKVDTPIDVIRNVEAPAKGDLPELHQPHQVVDGKWRPDKDPAKRAEHQKMLDEAAARWQAPTDLPVINNKDNQAEPDKDIPNAVAIARPTPPRMVEMPAFQGDMAGIIREAGGDWNKVKELLADKDIIFFDFETTGVNAEDGNEPWQVAAVRMRNGEIIDRINIFMNPGRSIEGTYAGRDTDGVPNAVDADGNKLTDEFLAKQPNQEEAMKQLLEWAGPGAIFGAQNMAFDEEVARRIADRHGLDWAPAGLIDTLPMAKDIFKDQPKENRPKTPKGRESYALGNLAKFLGIDLSNWHAADADAEAAAKIFNALIEKGIEFDAGKDLFDVDARNDEYVAKLDAYNAEFAQYQDKLAQYEAAKLLREGLEGKPVNVDDVVKAATPNKAEGQEVDAGPVGLEPEPVRANPEPVVLDFTPNVDFPRGKMILKDRDWALDDKNTVLLPRENIRMRDLLPGDFMQSKDGNTVWQVVAVRGGEEFGLAPGKVRVYRRNVDTGELSTYEHFHGVFLDGVRRPINPRDLDAPATIAPEEGALVIANEKEDVANIEEKSVAGDVVFRKSVDIGGFADGYIRIKKNKEGRYEVLVGIVDNNDEALLTFTNDYRTYEAAVAEAEAVLKERADELLAEKRQGMAEPEEARAKDVPVSRGDLPANANDAPQIIEVENLPADIVGKVKIEDIGEDKPEYKSDAVVHDAEGDLVAHQSTRHGNKSAAEKEGRDFVNRVADSIQNPEKPAEEPKPKKPLTPNQIKALEEKEAIEKDNNWVEDNAGLQEGVYPGELKAGEHFLWNAFFGQYEEILDVTYVGFLNRYRITVQNRVTGEKETRYYEADTPIRNVRLLGAQDDEFERIDKKGGTNRGAKRGVIKRAPLEERIVAKTGRPMGGRFDIEGFFKDKNGNPLVPGDVVVHPVFGRGVVKKREGAQVEEGKKAGGVARQGKVYLDNLMVQFENEDKSWVLNQGGRLVKAKKLEKLEEIDSPIVLPDFRGGRKAPNLRPVAKQQELMEVKKEEKPAPAPAAPEAPQRVYRGNVLDKKGKEFDISVVKIGDVYEAAVFPKEGAQRGDVIAKGNNFGEVQAAINRFVEDVINSEDGNKVLRQYAGVPEPEVQPVLTRETAVVPDLPPAKKFDLKGAKEAAKKLRAELEAKDVPNLEPFAGVSKEKIDADLAAKKNYLLSVLKAPDVDRRRGDRFAKDMRRAADYAKRLGWFDEAARLDALADLNDGPRLRPMDAEFEAKADALKELYPDIYAAYYDAKQRLGWRYADGINAIRRDFHNAVLNPDLFNGKFRNAVIAGPRNIDNFIAEVKKLIETPENNELIGRLEKLKAAFGEFGELPKLPVPQVGSDQANQFVARVARELEGLDIDMLRNAVPGASLPVGNGDWKLKKGMSRGINGVFLLENSVTKEQVLVKFDDDYEKRGGKYYGNGIRAEEMIAMLYKDLGFAQPAVKIINPDAKEARDGGLAVMEYANTGFFGLQNIKIHDEAGIYNLDKVSPEHRAEVMRFVVANAIVGNTDRHPGNFMWGIDPDTGKARLIPIDNGLALFNGAFGKAEQNADDPLHLNPMDVIRGRHGNRHHANRLASEYVKEIGLDQAESEIVEFATRMRERAAALKLIDPRAADYIAARADYIIQNAKSMAKFIERGGLI